MSVVATQAETQTFRANAAEIGDMDRWVEHIGTRWGIPELALFRARICLTEVAANVLEHGGTIRGGNDQIVITLRNRAPAVEIEFIDAGMAFNPIDAPSPAAAAPSKRGTDRGRGLILLHSYASQMKYRRERDQNILQFRVSAA